MEMKGFKGWKDGKMERKGFKRWKEGKKERWRDGKAGG